MPGKGSRLAFSLGPGTRQRADRLPPGAASCAFDARSRHDCLRSDRCHHVRRLVLLPRLACTLDPQRSTPEDPGPDDERRLSGRIRSHAHGSPLCSGRSATETALVGALAFRYIHDCSARRKGLLQGVWRCEFTVEGSGSYAVRKRSRSQRIHASTRGERWLGAGGIRNSYVLFAGPEHAAVPRRPDTSRHGPRSSASAVDGSERRHAAARLLPG